MITLVNFCIKHKTQLSEKQVDCLLMEIERIFRREDKFPDYFLLSDEAKRIYIVKLIELEEQFWIYIIKHTLKFEKMYIFS